MQAAPARYAVLSVAAALTTLGLKSGAYFLTGSVGLMSDAAESVVNLAAAGLALWVLILAARPADEHHAYGHGKAEYFSSVFEGALIIVAAGGIAWAAWGRFLSPEPPQRLGLGLGLALVASAVNFATARVLLAASRRYDSITLEADARHLMTDVWTSAGLVAGLGVLLIAPPSWAWLDPAVALVMAGNIVFTGMDLIRRSFGGLMDAALPDEDIQAIGAVIRECAPEHVTYHALRTRRSGARRFIDFHLLLPGATPVAESHALCCDIEDAIHKALPGAQVTIHVEPIEEESSRDGRAVGGLCEARVGGTVCPFADEPRKD
ncbi:cation diffusion facilitator family transporter [Desulfocurvus sp. DL9XJH121]